jgi:hypothetical protein
VAADGRAQHVFALWRGFAGDAAAHGGTQRKFGEKRLSETVARRRSRQQYRPNNE